VTYHSGILLGRIVKAHGFDGTVTVKLERAFIENYSQPESVFLEIEGKPVPFFISRSVFSGSDTLHLGFSGYDSVDKVAEFAGCRIFLTSEAEENEDDFLAEDMIGYILISGEEELVGRIREMTENSGQIIMTVSTDNGKEILVPFHEDLLISFDRKKKKIVMDLPEGLMDIN